MTMKAHIAELHGKEAATHAALADGCGDVSKCFNAMGKAAGGDDGQMYAKIASAFDKCAKAHAAAAAYHENGAATMKASDVNDLTKVRPDGFSSIIPSDVPDSGFGIRAVPRHGSPSMPDKLDKAVLDGIAPEFRHLLGDEA
jgi:hypothetical protein